jgi:predicted phosphodiesterase
MPLKIQIVSDLHLEFWPHKKVFNFIKPSAPILALLGDTCCVGSDNDFAIYEKFINEIIDKFELILVIPGNHEYYYNPDASTSKICKRNTMKGCNDKLRALCNKSPKLYFLKNQTLQLKSGKTKYLLIGSVLWSYVPNDKQKFVSDNMSDYQYIYITDKKTGKIQQVTAAKTSSLFETNYKYIRRQINFAKKNNMKAIVLTHHKPYVKNNYGKNDFDYAYESNCEKLFKPPLLVWCYGHTHVRDDRVLNGVKVISNPKGYPNQRTKFDNSFCITI